VLFYDLVPSSAFLRYVLKALPQPPFPVLATACDRCLSCHKPFNGVRLPRTCHFCARLLCSACSSLCAPSTAFPERFLDLSHSNEVEGHNSNWPGSRDNPDDLSTAGQVASSSRVDEPAAGVIQVKKGSLRNSVCEDCHVVLSVSSSEMAGPPQQTSNRLSGR